MKVVTVEMVGEFRGQCGVCGGPDARHRVADAANDLMAAGTPWEKIVAIWPYLKRRDDIGHIRQSLHEWHDKESFGESG